MKKQFTTFLITIIFLIFGVFALANQVYAETEVSGNITSDTTWTLSNSPYIITSTIQVLQGLRLTIEPGVVLKFNKGTGLVVDGEIYAVGNINNLITFTTNEPNPNKLYKVPQDWYWGGIRTTENAAGATFNTNNDYLSGNIIKYSIIEYAGTGLSDDDNSPLFIDNNIIKYNNRGIQSYGRSVISNNVIDDNASYGIYVYFGNPIIHHNQIINNSVEASFYPDFNVWGMAAIYFSGGGGQIYNNFIKDNGRGLSFSFSSSPEVKYNNIYNNQSRNFLMQQSTDMQTKYNYLGSTDKSVINSQITDYYDNVGLGKIIYEPYGLAELKFDGTDTFSQPQACTSWTYSDWSACSSNGLQTRSVISSIPNGCSGGNPALTQSCTFTPPTCTSWTYSNWSNCSNGQQTRTIASSQPANCTGGNPILNQSCNSIPLCTENNWTSTLTPTNCPNNGQQIKKWTKVGECQGGISRPSEETVSCDYQVPTCTNFAYSDWGICSSSGVQSRTTLSASPSGCAGGNPVLSKSCNYIPSCTSDIWSCGDWSNCSANGSQSRTCTKTFDCPDAQTESPTSNQGCEIPNQNSQNKSQSNQVQNELASTKNNEQEVNQEKNIIGSQVAEQRKSEVASAVQEILQVAERDGGIGQQVKIIAQTQGENQEKLETSLQKVQNRSGLAKFFVGPNYEEINNAKKLLEQNREQIKQLNQVKNRLVNQDDQQKLTEQIKFFEQSNQEIENSLNTSQRGFSLFGWLFKLFAK